MRKYFLFVLLITLGSFSASYLYVPSVGRATETQGDARTKEEKLASKLMAREIPYRVILPVGYSNSTERRYPVLYLLHGLTGNYRNWTETSKITTYAENYPLIIVTPEGQNGWYTDSPSLKNANFESYIIKELIPEIDRKYRTVSGRSGRMIAGLSMGGYGALKFGMKYPEMFRLAGSFSGALGVADFKMGEGMFVKTIDEAFGPHGSETRRSNDLFALVRDVSPERIKSLPFMYLDCGTEDFLIQNNREFVDLLTSKKIPHEYRQLPGSHTWPYWDNQVQEFLRVTERFTK